MKNLRYSQRAHREERNHHGNPPTEHKANGTNKEDAGVHLQ